MVVALEMLEVGSIVSSLFSVSAKREQRERFAAIVSYPAPYAPSVTAVFLEGWSLKCWFDQQLAHANMLTRIKLSTLCSILPHKPASVRGVDRSMPRV